MGGCPCHQVTRRGSGEGSWVDEEAVSRQSARARPVLRRRSVLQYGERRTNLKLLEGNGRDVLSGKSDVGPEGNEGIDTRQPFFESELRQQLYVQSVFSLLHSPRKAGK